MRDGVRQQEQGHSDHSVQRAQTTDTVVSSWEEDRQTQDSIYELETLADAEGGLNHYRPQCEAVAWKGNGQAAIMTDLPSSPSVSPCDVVYSQVFKLRRKASGETRPNDSLVDEDVIIAENDIYDTAREMMTPVRVENDSGPNLGECNSEIVITDNDMYTSS